MIQSYKILKGHGDIDGRLSSTQKTLKFKVTTQEILLIVINIVLIN